MESGMEYIHDFKGEVASMELPQFFGNPFFYSPHPLVQQAVQELMSQVSGCVELMQELAAGKMLGVLVVTDGCGRLGYLAAYSGNLAFGQREHWFVPAIYNMLEPDGIFKQKEAEISAINHKIADFKRSAPYLAACAALEQAQAEAGAALLHAKEQVKLAKAHRDALRSAGLLPEQLNALQHESQYQKAELKRLEARWRSTIDQCKARLALLDQQVATWKVQRKEQSQQLQEWLFDQFVVLNARGESMDLHRLFQQEVGALPPAGAGECAGPKLLNFAYQHGWHPVAMGEFWWGASPKGEVRHQGLFYPSCQSKCRPILGFMLQGLNVEKIDAVCECDAKSTLEVLYDDDDVLVVNKPAEQLSVPGKEGGVSVQEQVQTSFAQAGQWCAVHRLDMSTSGILVVAKNGAAYRHLQQQFATRKVKKRYVAVLDGEMTSQQGTIELPLCANRTDRPRQMVSYEQGKAAVTYYEVKKVVSGRTLVWLYPLTGRTHQLRVHAAHCHGLNAPIVGDRLYGRAGERLLLHAAELTFQHPTSGKLIRVVSEPSFMK